MKKVCVATTIHYPLDTRIFYKQIQSLSKYYKVHYYAKGTGDRIDINNVEYIELPDLKGFKGRICTFITLFKLLINSNFDIYHFHDPELLIIGLFLKLKGKKIVFDQHEDVLMDFKVGKQGIGGFNSILIAEMYKFIFLLAKYCFDWFILAEDSYTKYYNNCSEYTVVHNYPIIRYSEINNNNKFKKSMVYVGSITKKRGAIRMITLLHHLNKKDSDIDLHLIGSIDETGLEEEIRAYSLRYSIVDKLKIHGKIPNIDVYHIIENCNLGLALLDGTVESFTGSFPTKLFEYMISRLPFLVTDVPLWSAVATSCHCGISVDISDVEKLNSTAYNLLKDKELCMKMGTAGYNYAKGNYNWENEEIKLQNIYREILN